MATAKALVYVKRIASALLVLCFALPLSRCAEKVDYQGKATATNTYLYGYEMAEQGLDGVKAKTLDGAGVLLAVVTVFFVPIICLGLTERLQAVVYFFGALVSEYILYGWVFRFSTSPQIGGIIAITCWLLLFCASSVTIFPLLRSRRLFKSADL